jgi:hypothetical protein
MPAKRKPAKKAKKARKPARKTVKRKATKKTAKKAVKKAVKKTTASKLTKARPKPKYTCVLCGVEVAVTEEGLGISKLMCCGHPMRKK